MTILVAPDKFKGSLTARQVCSAIEEGLRLADPSCKINSIPLADGGEGTCDLLTSYSNGRPVITRVSDPLFREIESSYGISGDGQTAFVEMAKASGLQLLTPAERNPLETSSLGTGQLIADALDRNVKHVVVGIGGSATNDAGIGMASALGFSFRSDSGELLKPTGKNLIGIASIDKRNDAANFSAKFTILCDVVNALFGPNGAAFVFGPQKGASPSQVEELDRGLRHFAAVAFRTFGIECNFPGAGAAGGAGAGARVFLDAEVRKGFEFVSRFTNLEENIRNADLVITGEGKIDMQTLSGKVVAGVATICRRNQKRCVGLAGKCELSGEELNALGLHQVLTLTDNTSSEAEAMREAYSLLREKAKSVLRS